MVEEVSMQTYRLDLEFLDDQKSDLPHNPIASVYVKSCSHRTSDGPSLITPDCVTIRELEYHIDELQAELEAIRKKAVLKFATDDRRQTERARSRSRA